MSILTRYMTLSLMLLACISPGIAQTGFFVPKSGKIFFSGNAATIYSDVNLQGQMGVGRSALVNFKGHQWINTASADITDEKGGNGLGGMIRFMTPDTGVLLQSITSGYNAASRSGPV